jgi:hypothetical protein
MIILPVFAVMSPWTSTVWQNCWFQTIWKQHPIDANRRGWSCLSVTPLASWEIGFVGSNFAQGIGEMCDVFHYHKHKPSGIYRLCPGSKRSICYPDNGFPLLFFSSSGCTLRHAFPTDTIYVHPAKLVGIQYVIHICTVLSNIGTMTDSISRLSLLLHI